MTPGGYAGKWLDVDLTRGRVEEFTLPTETLEQYFGGRGIATKMLWTASALSGVG